MKQHLGCGLHEDNTDCQTLCFASVQSKPPQRRLHLTGTPHHAREAPTRASELVIGASRVDTRAVMNTGKVCRCDHYFYSFSNVSQGLLGLYSGVH